MLCLTSARFNMTAIVLVQGADTDVATTSVPSGNGREITQQDPETGDLIRVWMPEDTDPGTGGIQIKRIKLIARGIIDGGIRVAGTTQRYTPQGRYENIDFVKVTVPKNVILTKRDRVTDIRGPHGELLWKEEESDDAATVFNVMGMTPVMDPFGRLLENTGLLQRSEVQQYGN